MPMIDAFSTVKLSRLLVCIVSCRWYLTSDYNTTVSSC